MVTGREQLKRERDKGRDSMGWDRIVHRGLRNKWSDSPAAILFRLHDKAFKWIKPRRSREVDVVWLATWFYKIWHHSYNAFLSQINIIILTFLVKAYYHLFIGILDIMQKLDDLSNNF